VYVFYLSPDFVLWPAIPAIPTAILPETVFGASLFSKHCNYVALSSELFNLGGTSAWTPARDLYSHRKWQLQGWVNCRPQPEEPKDSHMSWRVRKNKGRTGEEKHRTWLETGLPALYGPHCNRPWVQVLSAIAHATGAIR